jgi:hypothetical protein
MTRHNLAAENRILKARLPRLRLCDGKRQTLAEIRKRLGSKALEKVACIACSGTCNRTAQAPLHNQ